jgi:hypothetical protein
MGDPGNFFMWEREGRILGKNKDMGGGVIMKFPYGISDFNY